LTTNPLLVTELGTRHREALGISEEADCIAIVASEETGKVSIAIFGEIELDVPLERVERLLSERLDRDEKRTLAPQARGAAAVVQQSTLDRP
jgi:diadenylate cyclase